MYASNFVVACLIAMVGVYYFGITPTMTFSVVWMSIMSVIFLLACVGEHIFDVKVSEPVIKKIYNVAKYSNSKTELDISSLPVNIGVSLGTNSTIVSYKGVQVGTIEFLVDQGDPIGWEIFYVRMKARYEIEASSYCHYQYLITRLFDSRIDAIEELVRLVNLDYTGE